MINGIGTSIGGLGLGLNRAQEGERPAAVERPLALASAAEGGVLTTVARIAADGAPVDIDRVAALRAAIRAGGYRPDADAIAGRMIDADIGPALA